MPACCSSMLQAPALPCLLAINRLASKMALLMASQHVTACPQARAANPTSHEFQQAAASATLTATRPWSATSFRRTAPTSQTPACARRARCSQRRRRGPGRRRRRRRSSRRSRALQRRTTPGRCGAYMAHATPAACGCAPALCAQHCPQPPTLPTIGDCACVTCIQYSIFNILLYKNPRWLSCWTSFC